MWAPPYHWFINSFFFLFSVHINEVHLTRDKVHGSETCLEANICQINETFELVNALSCTSWFQLRVTQFRIPPRNEKLQCCSSLTKTASLAKHHHPNVLPLLCKVCDQGRIQVCFDSVQPLWAPQKTAQVFLQVQINNRIFC